MLNQSCLWSVIRRAPLTFALALMVVSGAASARPLLPNPAFDAGNLPDEVQIVDLNHDGWMDQVVTDYGQAEGGPPGISVLLGRGSGSFAPALFQVLAGTPVVTVAAEFTGDANFDLAILLYSGGLQHIALFAGDGAGGFGPEQVLASSSAPGWIAAGDFDADGRADLLVASNPSVQVLFGRGDGTFTSGPPISVTFPARLAVGDLNADGRSDFVAYSYDYAQVVVGVGHGDGSFTVLPGPGTGTRILSAALVDLTGDGRDDLALEREISNSAWSVFTYVGRGDGTFDAASSTTAAVKPGHLVPGDINGDGREDLIAFDSMQVVPLTSRGDGTFDEQPRFVVGDGNYGAAIGDLDGDGRPDLAVVAGQSNASFVLFGNGDGTFGPAGKPFVSGAAPQNVVAADFNGDGRKDIAIAEGNALSVRLGNGDGTFGPETLYPMGLSPWAPVAADFDRDGDLDIAVTVFNWSSLMHPPVPAGSVRVLLGLGDGTFTPGSVASVGLSPRSIAVGDVNGDSLLDLITANEGVSDFGLYGDLSVLLGNGDGTFAPETRIPAGLSPTSVAVGDFNGDSALDLVVAHRGDNGSGLPGDFSLLPGHRDGTFGPLAVLSQGVVPRSVAVSDFNGDGRDDVACVDEGTFDHGGPFTPGHLTVYLSQPDGSLGTAGPVEAGISPYDVRVADIDLDGVKDILLSNDASYITLLGGIGNGTFRPQERYGFGRTEFLLGGDFDTDGFQDLALSSSRGLFFLAGLAGAPLVQDLRLSTASTLGKGSGTLTWTTTREIDLSGFNVVTIDNSGRRVVQNLVVIPCEQCVTGAGIPYAFFVPKHKSGRDVYLEVLHRDGSMTRFGPAVKQ